MADFRKLFLALAALTLVFTTVASAQSSTQPYSCNATGVPTLARAEGINEPMGDVLLTCAGVVPTDGIQANIRVTLPSTNITSRILSGSTNEALLILNELTNNPLTGGTGWRGNTVTYQNVYQGTVISNTVTEFDGVIIAAPGSTGVSQIRITNIRANASALGVGAAIFAVIDITGSTTIPVNNRQVVVADTVQGLGFTVTPGTFKNCVNPFSAGFTLNFKEGHAAAFRQKGDVTLALNQTPGGAYPNESVFNPGTLVAGSTLTDEAAIGQASQGTRLLGRISGVPSGVTLTAPTPIAYADGLVATAVTGWASDFSGGTLASPGSVTVSLSGGAGVVLYEITASPNTSLATVDTVSVLVSVSYTVPSGILGTANVMGTFAPLSTVFTASSTAPEPRFVDNGANTAAFVIGACRTLLLFPFVTNQAGFDTGIAISNTSMDPVLTLGQSGTCALYYYGNVAGVTFAANPQTTLTVGPGLQAVGTLSSGGVLGFPATPGFQGYIFAICNFQFAHGYAFISDMGAQKLAQGYLALVVPDRSSGRQPQDSSLGSAANEGEGIGN